MPPTPKRRHHEEQLDMESPGSSLCSHLGLVSIPEQHSERWTTNYFVGESNNSVDSQESFNPRMDLSNQNIQLLDAIPMILTTKQRKNDDSDISHQSNRSGLSIQEQKISLDEAYMMYTRAENAALMIQKKFRDRHPEFAKDIDDRTSKTTDQDLVSECEDKKEEQPSPASVITSIFIVCTMLVPILLGWISKCIGYFSGCSDPADGVIDDGIGATNIAGKGGVGANGGGGGGGSGPSPVQQMAGQAAGAAGAGAAAGVAAAGVVAGAAGAAAGAAAAGVASSAVGVAAAAAATIVGVAAATGAMDTLLPVTVPIMTACGISNPQVLPGRVSFLLEGFYREFDDRETTLLENLMVEAYNNITLGPDRDLCQDRYLRELQSATLFNQTFFPQTEFNNSYIEASFETITLCDGCPSYNPMFGDTTDVLRRRLQEQLSSGEFFQLFLQKLILDVKDLSEQGEIMEGFVQMKRGYIIDSTSGEEAMVTEISTTFNEAGDVSTLTMTFTETGQESIVNTVNVLSPIETDEIIRDAPTIVVTIAPTTLAPTKAPTLSFMPSENDATRAPSESPSVVPTGFPSLSPSASPTKEPSISPSDSPTNSPSNHPTIKFSGQPTDLPSKNPSRTPSASLSVSPSNVPSVIPSVSPSAEPSVVPSDSPSNNPSSRPSGVPSVNPSNFPSAKPSIGPSMVPSHSPTDSPSRAPSDSPSLRPTKAPTKSPTPKPSKTPTMVPSHSPSTSPPTKSPTKRPSAAPSTSRPSNSPSLRPTRPPTPLPTKAPTTLAPSKAPVTLTPTMTPTVRVHPNKGR